MHVYVLCVCIAGHGICCSQVGTNAETVPKGSKEENATMWLNLTVDDRSKEHLVMHEFGHALGLGHEHQQAYFWNNIGKFLRKDCIAEHFRIEDVKIMEDSGPKSQYDPDSIMHYW